MKMPAIMFFCAIKQLEEAIDNERPISSLMKQKWIDDAGGFVGDCETLLRLFRSESTDAWERKIAAYIWLCMKRNSGGSSDCQSSSTYAFA